MYFKVFTDDQVLMIQAHNKTDVQNWMQREFNRNRQQFALIAVDYQQIVTGIKSGNHLMLLPAGQLAKPRLKHRIKALLSPQQTPLRTLLANGALFGWLTK